ncbi:tetratricopeptide repeat protein [Intestinibacter sp.]
MKTKILVMFTIITAIGVGMIILKDNFGEYNKQVNYAYRLLEDGKYEEAVLAFNKAIDIDEKSERAYCGLMDTYKRQNGEDANQKIYEVASRAMLTVEEVEKIQKKYEEIQAEYIAQNGKDILPKLPKPNKIPDKNDPDEDDPDEEDPDKNDPDEDDSYLYEELIDELSNNYGMIQNKTFRYLVSEDEDAPSVDNGIIRIVDNDLNNDGIPELIVCRAEDTNLIVEVYTIKDDNVERVSVYTAPEVETTEDYIYWDMFSTMKYENNGNVFIKDNNGKKYLCIEMGKGMFLNQDEHTDGKNLIIYEFDGDKLNVVNAYEAVIFGNNGIYQSSDALGNTNGEYENSSDFVQAYIDSLADYGLDGLWSDISYLTYNEGDYKIRYRKSSERCSNIKDIISIKAPLQEDNDEGYAILQIDTCN